MRSEICGQRPVRCSLRLRSRLAIGTVLCVLLLIGSGSGCGRKVPPVPPPQYRPPAPADVGYSLEDNKLLLSWQVSGTAEKGVLPAGCRVFRAARNIGEDACPACPAEFVEVADLPLEAAGQQRQSYRESLQTGFLYSYKIACYTARGNPGAESQPVYVQFD